MPRTSLDHLLARDQGHDGARLAQEQPRSVVCAPPRRFSPAFVQQLQAAQAQGRLSVRKAAKVLDLSLGELTAL